MHDGIRLNVPDSTMKSTFKAKAQEKLVGKHVDSSNPNALLVPGQKPSSMFPGVSSQMSSRDSNLKKRTVDDSRMKQVSQMTGGNGGSQFYQTGDPAAVKKPGVKSRAPGG